MDSTDIEQAFSKGFRALLENKIRRATVYLSPTCTVKVSNVRNVGKRDKYVTLAVTYGTPNYEERLFIKACKLAKEPFPVKRVQFKFWPKKK